MNGSRFIATLIIPWLCAGANAAFGGVTTVLSANDEVGNVTLEVYQNTDVSENPAGVAMTIVEAGFGAGGGRIQVVAPGGKPRNVRAPAGWGYTIAEDDVSPGRWIVTWLYLGFDPFDPTESVMIDGTQAGNDPLVLSFFSAPASEFLNSPYALPLTGEITGRIPVPPPFYSAIIRESLVNVPTLLPGGNVPPEALGFAHVEVFVNADNTIIDLSAAFWDAEDGSTGLTYAVTANSAPALFGAVNLDQIARTLTLDYAPNESGNAVLSVEATDSGGASVAAPLSVRIIGGDNLAPVLDAVGDQMVDELHSLAFTATATDQDDPPDKLTFSLANAPAGAEMTPEGAFSWTPTEDQGPGAHTFDVIVTDDGFGNRIDIERITVMVGEVNAQPVLSPIGDRSVDENTELSFTATASDADIPANDLFFSLNGAPAGASISADGQFSWIPTELQGGQSYAFDVLVTDAGTPALTNRKSLTVTVGKTNTAPVLSPIGNHSVTEKSTLSFSATAVDTDVPAEALAFSLSGAPSGAAITPDGHFTWTPTEAQGGQNYAFVIVVTDDGSPALSDKETIAVTVNEVNTAPELAAIGNQTVDETTALSFTATAIDTDVPTEALAFSLSGAPSGAAITPDGQFTWTPTEAQGGQSYAFDVVVIDDGSPALSDKETITVTVNEVNTAPELAAIGNQTVDEITALGFTATAIDTDVPTEALAFSLSGAPSGAAITPDGQFTWTPTEAQGGQSYAFDVVVADDGSPALSDKETIAVTVNEVNAAPELAAIGNQTVDEITALGFTATAIDTDVPTDALAFSLSGAPSGAAITPDGQFTWTPTEAQGGQSYAFDVVVTDDGSPALSDKETIAVTVNEVNTAPELAAIGNQTVDETTALSFTATAIDTDVPADALAFSLSGAPSGAAITPDGHFTWTPTEAQGGQSYAFDVVVTDDGSPALSDKETIAVTVNEVNAAPELAAIGNQTVDETTALSFTATAIDTDVPADALAFSLSGAPSGAAITPDGQFTWTPTEAQGGQNYAFVIVVTDDGSPALSDKETIAVTVNEVNTAPELAAIGNQTVDETTALSFTATAIDTDVPADALAFSLSGAPSGAAITPDGHFTWTPTEAQGGQSYAFDVVVTDDGSPALSDKETIAVTVNEVNAAPELAAIGNQTVDEITALGFTATAIDTDVPTDALAFSLSGAPSGAAITPDGQFTWTPTEAQGGQSYAFDVVVTDDGSPALSDKETIAVTVNEVNTAPELAAIGNQTVDETTALSFTATAIDTDVPADALAFSLSGAPSGAAITPDGHFTWTPTEAQRGQSYAFDVVVTDDGTPKLSDAETITVTVGEGNLPPILEPIDDQEIDELRTLEFAATASDGDDPPDSLAFNLINAPDGATITPDGHFTWTPAEEQGPGKFIFDVVVTDNGEGHLSARQSVTVTVNEVNSPPELVAIGNRSVDESATLSFAATAIDHDVPANALVFSLSGAPSGAAITPGGIFSWMPTKNQAPREYSFEVVVSDNGNPSLGAAERITVAVAGKSTFCIDRISRNAGTGELRLEWQVREEGDYTIESSEDMVEWTEDLEFVIDRSGSGVMVATVVPLRTLPARYYRIREGMIP